MRKESVYLPTLNSLFMQDANYRMHRHNLRNCKSSIDNYSNTLTINNQTSDLPPNQVVLLQNVNDESLTRKIKSKVLLRYHSTEPSQRDKNNLSPFEKRKLSDRDSQNSRIYQILQASKCSGYGLSKNNIENYYLLRERISKFIREGKSVKYKFKKSLIEISKRKELTKLSKTENMESSVVEQARKIISNSRNKKLQKIQKNHFSDIYLLTMRSNTKNNSTKRQSSRKELEKSQSASFIQQKNKQLVQKKQSETQRIATEPSFVKGMQNNQLQQKKYTMNFISQIKLKKKEKFVQKAILPRSINLKQQKTTVNDLQVVEVQPLPKYKKKTSEHTD